MDDNYQTYLNRLARMMLPEAYSSQAQHIHESYKFKLAPEGGRKPAFFPGFTIITPPAVEDSQNVPFYSYLLSCQEQLLQLSGDSGLIVPLPSSSFHFTLADLIWESAYLDACEKHTDYEAKLCSCIGNIFGQWQKLIAHQTEPIRWQMLGMIVMPRAIGVTLVPKDEQSYERIVQLRRALYQTPQLIALGIEQHYHLTAHVTLGYFGDVVPDLDRERLGNMFWELNHQWLENSPEFIVNRADLRKFDDMTRYYREPDWPTLEFSH
ncbi:MAG: DUF1868 domain-containing protein [Nostocaceae cyanobacterium]|nr:DUF1868 domain-containing protein [Nostocaceae cyanobacterium]